MAELIIHIGSHKTGSTSIQKACELADARGRKDGSFAYLNEVVDNKNIVLLKGEGEAFRARVNKRYLRPLLDPVAAVNVISTELFFFLDDRVQVEALAALARARFDRVRVVAYLRRQDLLASSHRNQVANGAGPAQRFYGAEVASLPALTAPVRAYLDYHRKLTALWLPVFGAENVIVAPFERPRLRDGDVVADFAQRTGVDFSGLEVEVMNVSQSAERAIVGMAMVKAGLPDRARKLMKKALPADTPKLTPPRAEAEAFLAEFAQSNAALAATFAPDGPKRFFDMSMDMYPDASEPDWTSARVMRLVETLVAEMAKGR
ncbi:hypothetical protein [Mesobacterium pallidum]|uniref:hypothetical protein n=1 Tax=Mesobacterium pallidum TaxID=2872037 RepID=UPI001EE39674|nr:hypothetical protein [Mesobacterium pallidum]